MNNRYKNIAIHSIAWISFLLYEWLVRQGVVGNPENAEFHLKIVVVRVLVLIPAVYLTWFFLLPKLFLKNKKFLFTFSLIALIIIDAFLMQTITYFFVSKGSGRGSNTYLESISILNKWLIYTGNITFNICFAMLFYFIERWIKDDKKRRELETAKKEAELNLLKSQIQPHFIFNTINNIYSLSKQGSPYTTELIYRLSGLLEYMLYDSTHDWVSLNKEIGYIKNYLEIEKLRYGKRLNISFNLYGISDDIAVPPLILLPFVENSFKHGLSQTTNDCWLNIEISYNHPCLLMKVENSKPEETLAPYSPKGGIGISNVLQRLNILLEGDFELKQMDATDSYLVTLKIRTPFKNDVFESNIRPSKMPDS